MQGREILIDNKELLQVLIPYALGMRLVQDKRAEALQGQDDPK